MDLSTLFYHFNKVLAFFRQGLKTFLFGMFKAERFRTFKNIKSAIQILIE